MSKIYTKTGDKGFTSLYDGDRVHKQSLLINLLGEHDELSSRIGVVCSMLDSTKYNHIISYLRNIQRTLHDFNTHIATQELSGKTVPQFEQKIVLEMENFIDRLESEVPVLKEFILPGVTQIDSHIHLCRTQSRKVERMMHTYNQARSDSWACVGKKDKYNPRKVTPVMLQYMNRLSDFFFVLARWMCLKIVRNSVHIGQTK